MFDDKPKACRSELLQPLRHGIATVCVLILTTVLLSGCNGLHLHNSADEALAQKASDSFKAADVGKFIESERKALAVANERDLAVTRRNIMAERDAAIIMALSEDRKVTDLVAYLKGRLETIGNPDDVSKQKMLSKLEDKRQRAMVARDAYVVATSAKNISPPSFPPSNKDEKAVTDLNDPTITLLFNAYKAQEYFNDLELLQKRTGGLIGELNQKIAGGNELQKNLREEIKDKKTALEDVVNKYKDQAKDTTKDVETLRGDIQKALEAFDNVATKFESNAKKVGLEDLLAEIHLEKLKKARDEVSKFLSAFAQENSATEQTPSGSARSEAEVAGRAAAILVGAEKSIHDASTQAKLVPLVFEQERLKLEIDRAQRAVDRGQQRLTLLERQRETLVAEGIKLIDAVNSLNQADPKATATVTLLLAKAEAKAKGQVIHALFIWADSIAIDKLRQEEIEVALISLDHDQALDASEFALNLWTHMIASPLQELVGYHASGLKSEDIANLIHAIGLTGIAVGVNR